MLPLLEELITEVVTGKPLKITGPDAGQCTAVAHAWELKCGIPIVYGNAKDTYENASLLKFDKTRYSPGLIPPVGAILVWDATWGGGDGHTVVVVKADATGFLALSQNDPEGATPQVRPYGYSNAIKGWFTPKGLTGDLVM